MMKKLLFMLLFGVNSSKFSQQGATREQVSK